MKRIFPVFICCAIVLFGECSLMAAPAVKGKSVIPHASSRPKNVLRKSEDMRALEEPTSGLPIISRSGSLIGEDHTLDFKTCLRFAVERQSEIVAADKGIEAAFWKAQEAHRHGIPAVKYQYRFAPVPRNVDEPLDSFFSGDITVFNSVKIEVGTPFYTFGQLSLGQNLGDMGISEALERKEDKMSEVAMKVYQLYYGLVLANEINQLMNRAVTALEENIKKAEAEEYVDQVQILKFKTITFELYRQLDESKRKQEMAKRSLRIQMGYSQNSDIEFQVIPLEPFSDRLEAFSVYMNRAETESTKRNLLELGIKAKRTQYELEKRKLAPILAWGSFFEAGRAPFVEGEEDTNTFNRPFNYRKAGVGLQLEGTFDWASARSKIRQTEAEYYKALLLKNSALDGIELEIRDSYLEAKEKRKLMERSKSAQEISQQIVFLTKSNLDIGIGDKKDYTDALQSYLLFQGRYYEAVYNYNIALIKLKQLSGTLDEEIRELISKGEIQGRPSFVPKVDPGDRNMNVDYGDPQYVDPDQQSQDKQDKIDTVL